MCDIIIIRSNHIYFRTISLRNVHVSSCCLGAERYQSNAPLYQVVMPAATSSPSALSRVLYFLLLRENLLKLTRDHSAPQAAHKTTPTQGGSLHRDIDFELEAYIFHCPFSILGSRMSSVSRIAYVGSRQWHLARAK